MWYNNYNSLPIVHLYILCSSARPQRKHKRQMDAQLAGIVCRLYFLD